MTNRNLPSGLGGTRRDLLVGGAVLAAAACMPRSNISTPTADATAEGALTMSTITTKDGTSIFYKDWGPKSAQPIVFSHGWPLNADAWDEQLFFFASNGYRAIAYDRRGHGRSSQPWNGNDMDTFAEDLSSLIEQLALKDAVLAGHSSGAGDVTRYLGRHGTQRVAKAALVSSIPPLMLKTDANPGGIPKSGFDAIRQGVSKDRAQFYKDLAFPFFGANRPESKVSEGVRDAFFIQCMQAGFKAAYDGIKAFSETDFTEDLKKIDIPVLVIHGEDDQNVPIDVTAKMSSKILKRATLKIYPGAPHGLVVTHRDRFNADLMAFIKASA
jgi:non-heme chloroperoxidase